MSDETRTPGDDARIRALLAELGSGPDGEAMPPEIVARLDDTLARLVTERGTTEQPGGGQPGGEEPGGEEQGSATVVPLRRRWAARAAVTAAAVIVLGAGGVAAANLGVFGGSSSDSKAGSTAGGSTAADSAPEAASPSPSEHRALTGEDAKGLQAVPLVRSGSFAADASRLVRNGSAGGIAPYSRDQGEAADGTSEQPQDPAGDAAAARRTAAALAALSCPGPEITEGAVPHPIVYDGRAAVLVVHPESDGQQLVEAWSCGGGRKLDSARITP